jgi:hypothetical protein
MPRRILAGIGIAALAVRVAYVLVLMRDYAPDSDAHSYLTIARALAAGDGFVQAVPFGYDHPTAGRPPLFPALVGGVFELFGDRVGVAQAVNVLLGAVVVVAAAVVAARVAGLRAGLVAGAVGAVYPPLLANDVTLLAEPLALLLLLAAVVLLADGRTVRAGGVLGLLVLTRASAQWLVPVLVVWVCWRLGWRHALRVGAVALLVVAPWVVRNAVRVGGPVVVTSNGFNLNAQYSPEAREADGFVDAWVDPAFATLRLDHADEVALDDALRDRALERLADDPDDLVRVVASNVPRWFELRPDLNRDAERLDGRRLGVRSRTLPLFYLVSAAGLAGLVRARRHAAGQLLLVAAGTFTLVSLATVSVPRLRAPFDVACVVGAGVLAATVAGDRVVPHLPTRRAAPLRALLAIVVASGVVLGAAGFAWRAATHDDARREVRAALARDAGAFATTLDSYPLRSTGRPTHLDDGAIAAVARVTGALVANAALVPGSIARDVERATRAARAAAHELDVVALLTAGEHLLAAQEDRAPSAARVRDRYEHGVRPDDPALAPWTRAAAGASLHDAADALAALERRLR